MKKEEEEEREEEEIEEEEEEEEDLTHSSLKDGCVRYGWYKHPLSSTHPICVLYPVHRRTDSVRVRPMLQPPVHFHHPRDAPPGLSHTLPVSLQNKL